MNFFRFVTMACLVCLPTMGAAQTGNVNDCTLIKDAIELRDCILRYGNVRTQPPATIESNAPAQAPLAESPSGIENEIVEVPSKAPARKGAPVKRGERPSAKQSVATKQAETAPAAPPLPTPNPKDTITHIEQIQMSKDRR